MIPPDLIDAAPDFADDANFQSAVSAQVRRAGLVAVTREIKAIGCIRTAQVPLAQRARLLSSLHRLPDRDRPAPTTRPDGFAGLTPESPPRGPS